MAPPDARPAAANAAERAAAQAVGGGDALHLAAMPWVFVLIWSTGFVVARLAMPHVGPMTFLVWRYVGAVAAFALWAALARAAWPDRAQWPHLAVSGLLMHAGYLGGVWAAVRAGAPAGTVALIVGLQPLLTALWESGRGTQRIRATQWLGLGVGLVGLALVVWPKMRGGEVDALSLGLSVLALASITTGTLYQKRFVRAGDVRTGSAVQLAASLAATLPLAWLEPAPMVWNADTLAALGWSVLVLTLGGSSLLMLLIRRGAATRVTSLFYLVPPCTALMAWAMFGESLGAAAIAGMGMCALGVVLVRR